MPPSAKLPVFTATGEADVAAEQIQRAMGQVDDAQQPEDQRKAARHHKQQCRERQSVEELKDAHP
jgi:hypothetical protein